MRGLTYSETSPSRLTDAETTCLADLWPGDMSGTRVLVTDGYELHLTGGELVVGRAGLHQRMALARLENRQDDRGLRGLFYPGATPSWSMLHQAALYFDEVFLVHPGGALVSRGHRRALDRPRGLNPDGDAVRAYQRSQLEFVARLESFDREVLPLKQAGVLRAVPPQAQADPDFLRLITADLADPEFCRIAGESWSAPVFVAARKMEPLLPLVGADGGDPDEIRATLHSRAVFAGWDRGVTGDHVAALFAPTTFGVREVHPTLAATILLNHAFLLADRHGLIPFTDDRRSVRLMQRKLRRIEEMSGFTDFRRDQALSTTALAMRVLDEQLPRFEFRDIEDVLAARDKLKDQLDGFREAMRAFAGEIEESPHDQEFHRRVERIVSTRVQPAITALQREVRTSRDSFVAKCVRNVQAGAVPIIGSVLVGLPASVIIGLSAGVLTFEAALETYLDVRAKKRHGLTLFLKP